MAISISNNVFAGQRLDQIIYDAFQQATLIRNSGFRVIPGLKTKVQWPDFTTDAQIQQYACEMTPEGNLTGVRKTAELCEFALNLTTCKRDLEGTMFEDSYRRGNAGAWTDDSELLAAIIALVTGKMVDQQDDLLLNGNTTYTNVDKPYLDYCDGLLYQFSQDDDVTPVSSPVAIDKANVATEFDRLFNAAPPITTLGSEATMGKLYVSSNVYMAALMYASTAAANDNPFFYTADRGTGQADRLQYIKWDVIRLHNLPDNSMFFTFPNNVGVLTDVTGEFNELRIVDKSQYDAFTDVIQLGMRWRSGIMYGRGEWVTTYGI